MGKTAHCPEDPNALSTDSTRRWTWLWYSTLFRHFRKPTGCGMSPLERPNKVKFRNFDNAVRERKCIRDIKLPQAGLKLAQLLAVRNMFLCFDVTSRVDIDCTRLSLCQT